MNRLGIAMFGLWVAVGCSQRPETIDTSGSHPTFGATAPMTPEAKDAEVETGRLQVLTPSGYTVYSEDGHKVAHEENDGVPAERRLSPGRYFVRLDQASPGRDFWVTVEKGRVTRVENTLWSGAPPNVK